MTQKKDLTLAVLREIRDEIRSTKHELRAGLQELSKRIDGTNARIDGTNERVDATNTRLAHVETGLLDLAEQQRFVVRHLQALTTRDRRLELEVESLRTRVAAIETRLDRE